MNKSFTLIEILVVIVVIGVLSAFILVGMSSITSKANIAKGQAFINSMDNALLLARVSQWKFDELSSPFNSGTVKDNWGTNDGTYYPVADSNNKLSTDCPYGNCLSFDGIDDYVSMGDPANSSLDFGTNDFSIEAWIKNSQSLTLDTNIYAIVSKFNNNINPGWTMILRGGSYNGIFVRIGAVSGLIDVYPSSSKNSLLSNGNWHNVIFTRTSGYGKIYIDGASVSGDISINKDVSNGNTSYIGYTSGFSGGISGTSPGAPFPGLIDDVRIYNQAIPTSEIQQNYYSGLNKLFKNNGIGLNDFNQRIVELKTNLSKYE